MAQQDELFSFSFRITKVGLFGAFALGLCWLYWKYPAYQDTLKFGGASAAVAVALYNATIARKAFELSVRDRKLAALSDLSERYFGSDAREFRSKCKELSTQLIGKDAAEISLNILRNDENKTCICDLMNLWEDVGYSVRHERVDLEMVNDLMGTTILNTYRLVNPILKQWRDADNHATAWEHFESLAIALENHRKNKRDANRWWRPS